MARTTWEEIFEATDEGDVLLDKFEEGEKVTFKEVEKALDRLTGAFSEVRSRLKNHRLSSKSRARLECNLRYIKGVISRLENLRLQVEEAEADPRYDSDSLEGDEDD